MENIYEDITKRYIKKNDNINYVEKMDRNLQPEVEKVKSIQRSLCDLDYISPSEANRLKMELNSVVNFLESFN